MSQPLKYSKGRSETQAPGAAKCVKLCYLTAHQETWRVADNNCILSYLIILYQVWKLCEC